MRAFTLIEVLFVLAIISILSALIFPVFLTARGQARQTVCASNLRQVGLSISMYTQDCDGHYPYAVDSIDRAIPGAWSQFPKFEADIPKIGLLHQVLQTYAHSPNIFACPSDTGFIAPDFNAVILNAFPSSYEKYGSSYYYRTEIAARHATESTILTPTQINVLFDPVGYWHGTLTPLLPRYNVLFADGHVKCLTRSQINEAWSTPLMGD